MSDLKLCINCRWKYNLMCGHASAPHSLVDGQPTATCETMRQSGAPSNACGPEGAWYEAYEAKA